MSRLTDKEIAERFHASLSRVTARFEEVTRLASEVNTQLKIALGALQVLSELSPKIKRGKGKKSRGNTKRANSQPKGGSRPPVRRS